jgi:hypothetical protein
LHGFPALIQPTDEQFVQLLKIFFHATDNGRDLRDIQPQFDPNPASPRETTAP